MWLKRETFTGFQRTYETEDPTKPDLACGLGICVAVRN